MKRLTSLATIATIALLAGCSGRAEDPTPGTPRSEASSTSPGTGANVEQSPPPGPSTPGSTASTSNREANLRALRDLEVFEVRDLAVNIPENANCYNLPCPGHEEEFVSYADAEARAAEALDRFTRTALDAAADAKMDERIADSGHCYDTDEQNLKALQALRVVVLGDLVLEAPGQNPNCYHAPFGQKLARIAAALRKP